MPDYIILIISLCMAFAITYVMIPTIINVSNQKELFDYPHSRKLHDSSTPNLGGIAFYTSIILSFSLSGYAKISWAPYILSGITILFISGLKDDILIISAVKKLILQCIAILIFIGGTNVLITSFGGILGIFEISYPISIIVTFFTMIVIVNAYNLIDGVDGLAGGIGIISSLFFGIWFYYMGMIAHAILATTVVGTLLAFLRFNFQPASIFMGDTGSQIIGFILGFLAITFVEEGTNSISSILYGHKVPVLVIAVLVFPLYDTLRVFTIRIIKGKSPFKPDRRHVHHELIDWGFSHRTVCYVIFIINLFIIGVIIALDHLNINLLLLVLLLLAILLFPTGNFKKSIFQKIKL